MEKQQQEDKEVEDSLERGGREKGEKGEWSRRNQEKYRGVEFTLEVFF